jgi:AcrR family transcriptional regulator
MAISFVECLSRHLRCPTFGLSGTVFRIPNTEHCSGLQGVIGEVDNREEQSIDKRVRADAQRSRHALLNAAKEVFATTGVDAPVREIADKAGVGIGTLYRHFPQRADLVFAVFRRELEACADAAPVLSAQYPPGEALELWIERFLGFIATKRGLVAAWHSGQPAFEPRYYDERLVPAFSMLLDAAAAAGEARAGINGRDLLMAIASLCWSDGAEKAKPMVRLLLDGLRYGAKPAASA